MATNNPMNQAPDDNGLTTFAAHARDDTGSFSALKAARAQNPAFALPADVSMKSLTPEAAAARHITQAFESNDIAGLVPVSRNGIAQELKSLGAETVPLTGTTVVKFRQTFNKVPVYGSLVSVELDEDNELLSINSATGEPTGVYPTATISPAEALHAASVAAGMQAPNDAAPRLNYYYDQTGTWRLVYIIENLPADRAKHTAGLMDFIIDAHSGEKVAELPRAPSLRATATDGQGRMRVFEISEQNAMAALRDTVLNIHTFDFEFRDPDTDPARLPGKYVMDQGGWNPMAISAHANATEVVAFLRNVLKRQNIDNAGGPLYSSINCVVRTDSPGADEWFNAYWNGKQMVYGQVTLHGTLTSLAVSLEVVGHEIFHGVTDSTARLEYARQPGALNESFSDIFGVIISNFSQADLSTWDWEVGEGLGDALRDMADPTRKGQPRTMADYVNLPMTQEGDWGGVHTNSGIHNFAAYCLMTSKAGDGSFLFTPQEMAGIFYIALTQQLSRTSNFKQCRTAVDLAAKSLLRAQPEAVIQAKLQAIARAYDAAGIP